MNRFAVPVFAILVMISLSGCHDDDYANAIPRKISALMEINPSGMANGQDDDAWLLLYGITGLNNVSESGLDVERPIYIFQTDDGTFGLCAKIDDEDAFLHYVSTLSGKSQHTTRPVEWRKCHFSLYRGGWLIGWKDNRLVAVGPIVAGQHKSIQQIVARWLGQNEDESGKVSVLYKEMEQHSKGGIGRLALKAHVLPENVSALLTTGLPKNADPKQVIISSDIQEEKDKLLLPARVVSHNERTDKALKAAHRQMRKVELTQIDNYDTNAIAHLMFNIDGQTYLPLLHNNASMQSVLTIANAAIDLDNIIKSIDGTCHLQLTADRSGRVDLTMTAPVKHTRWINDVAYWKQSAPSGTNLAEITTSSEHAEVRRHFVLTARKTEDGNLHPSTIYFGLYDDNRFYISTSRPGAIGSASIKSASHAKEELSAAGECKLALIVNMEALSNGRNEGMMATIGKMLAPVTRKYKYTLLYI